MTTMKTSDGTGIFYKDWGPREAPPIVFHHGWPLSADDWDNQMMFFLRQGFRVVAHDPRGHGGAPPIVFRHGWPLSADDWDNQMMFFLRQGFRVIAHDRRGHGRSAQTDAGH